AATTGGAGLLDTEKTLLNPHHALPMTGMTSDRLGARAGTTAIAGITMIPARDADFRIKAIGCLFEADVQRVFQVPAPVDLRTPATATAPAKDVAKNIVEGISKTGATHAAHATPHAARVGVDTGVAKAIIGRPLVFVGQNFVGFLGFLELLFGFSAVWVAVRMVFHCQPAISLAQLIVGGVLLDPQNLVVIAFCHSVV